MKFCNFRELPLSPKMGFMGINRLETIRFVQQRPSLRHRLHSSRDIHDNMKIALNDPYTFSKDRDVSPAF
ncbi:hypothetical protein T03_12785 [Trichinella britovi]|uniref:Uncharacterized protein n=1 Tax=Trichinella britovi TaxID=45882 RepID=A0A0V1C495_TRIBR|nr:hypothetical protein T03_12785 [Trichinella britovi]